MSQIEPGDREEMLLRGILNGDTTTNIEPGNRKEAYLKAILENGGGGGGGGSDLPDVTSADAGDFLRVNDDGEWDKDAGDDLARIDGYYESLTSGQTEQIISKVGVTNAEPYRLRPTGGSADVGNRKKIGKIVGASAAYNQLVDGNTGFTGFTADVTYDSTDNEFEVTFSSTAAGTGLNSTTAFDGIPSGHVCLISFEAKGSESDARFRIYLNNTNLGYNYSFAFDGGTSVYKKYAAVLTTSTPNQFDLYSKFHAQGGKMYVRNLQIIDLTEMFGADVAAAIASKETTLAGSGIAWVRSCGYLTKDFYPYNAGAFVSAKPSAHKTVGFNAWDEVWESGYINGSTGNNASSANYIRSKNYIPVVPNTEYYINTPYTMYMRYYDAGKNYLGEFDGSSPKKGDVSQPAIRKTHANCHYIRFYIQQTTYNSDICINLSHSGYRNGDYEAYSERVYPLADTELKGLLKVDDSGNLYADGDTYAPDGTVTRKFYEVSSADCTVGTYQLASARWYLVLPEAVPDIVPVAANEVGNIRASKYFTPITMNDSNGSSYGICHTDTASVKTRKFIFTIDSSAVTTQAEAETWVANHPFSILYECVESTDTGTAYAATMICDDFGTETFVDERTIPAPVGHETFYQANNADKLDHLPFPADADGDYIIHQSGKTMTLKATSSPLPALPTEDGSYNLKVTVSGDTKTLSWEAIS